MCLFLGPQATLLAHLRGVDSQRIGNARAKLVGLYEQRGEAADLVDAAALTHLSQRFLAPCARAQLERRGRQQRGN